MQNLIDKIKRAKGLYFHHLPKTGGTYAKNVLRDIAAAAGIPTHGFIHRDPSWPHMLSGLHNLDDDCLRVTIARDPLSLCHSLFHQIGGREAVFATQDRWWMSGRRPPFESSAEFMVYCAMVGDFAWEARAPGNTWSHTWEPGRARYDSTGAALAPEESINIADGHMRGLLLATLMRPLATYPVMSELLRHMRTANEGLTDAWIQSKNPGDPHALREASPVSYFWHIHEDGELQAWRVFHHSESPIYTWKIAQAMCPFTEELKIPKRIRDFCRGNSHLGYAIDDIPMCWPVFHNSPQNARQIRENSILLKLFSTVSGLNPSALPALWDYAQNPFHTFFKVSGACEFDIILRQEQLHEGLTWLGKQFDVDIGPERPREKVGGYERSAPYSTPWHEILTQEPDVEEIMLKRYQACREMFGYKTLASDIANYKFETPIIVGADLNHQSNATQIFGLSPEAIHQLEHHGNL